ncbi:hypothetical protein ACLESD_35080 [Pyxidicoccus sp. 3LFB2]
MSKRIAVAVGALTSVAMLLAACAPEEGAQEAQLAGEAQVSVQGLTANEIRSMVVTAQPANVTKELVYSPDAGVFAGTLVLPTGPQTLTANGYGRLRFTDGGTPDAGPVVDGGSTGDGGTAGLSLVATGTASIHIVANTTAAASMRIYDLTPPLPQPDIAPILHSMTASSVSALVGQAITLSVVAEDLDGDTLSYTWTNDCVGGAFSHRTAPTTSWSSSAPATCTLTVTVSSRGQTVSSSQVVTVSAGGADGGTGSAQVNGDYLPRPEVYRLAIFNGTHLPLTAVARNGATANLPNVRPDEAYTLEVSTFFGTRVGTQSTGLTVSCGTVVKTAENCPANSTSCFTRYTWNTPAAGPNGTACRVTASASNDTLTDSFSAGVLVK